MGPHPAVAAVRAAVRRSMAELPPGSLLLVACSGGADSLALAAGAAFEAPRLQLRAGGVTVDHGLQPGSASQAEHVGRQLAALGLDPVISTAVAVARDPGSGGPEAAARDARYQALRSAAARSGAAAVLLGHTLDDQAETVLLGLARGSGGRSLAGMAAVSGLWRRPMLGIPRDQAAAACAADRLQAWQDPHNSDPAFARVRVRTSLLPLMEQLLGPGVASALARTADQLRADADALDQIAALEAERMTAAGDLGADGRSVSIAALAALPGAVRTRLLKAAAGAAGCPPGALSARHVAAADALVTSWHGQGPADLPGGVRCERRYGRLSFAGPVPDIAEQAATAVVPVRTEDTGGRH